MASGGLVAGCLGMLLCLVLEIVGLATPHWYVLNYGSSAYLNAGLFQLCISDICYNYISYGFSWSVDYIGLTGSQCLGALLLLIGLIIGLVGCSNQSPRGPVQNIAGLAFGASACLIAGIVWFVVRIYVQYDSYFSLFTNIVGIELGYSFYLCAASAGITLILAITLCIVGSNMAPPQNATAPMVQQPGTTMVVMNSQQYPHPSQQQYGQPGYGHPAPAPGPPSYGQGGAYPSTVAEPYPNKSAY